MSQQFLKRVAAALIVGVMGGQGYHAYLNGVPVGERINGVVLHVTDGDTLRVNGIKIRIWGVDAPEMDQRGYNDAADVLRREALMTKVDCLIRDRDRYGRIVAQCFRDKTDIGGVVIRSGWARDYRRHTKGYYLKEETLARKERKGLWAKAG